MIRLKILLLTLAALALWAAHVFLLTPALARRGLDASRTSADKGALLLDQQVQSYRSIVAQSALQLGTGSALEEKLAWRRSVPNVEQLNVARSIVLNTVPETHRAAALVGLVNEAGELWAGDEAVPQTRLNGLDAAALAQGGPTQVRLVGNGLYAFAVMPLGSAEGAKRRPSVVLALPMPLQAWATEAARAATLSGVGIFSDGQLVSHNPGADKTLVRAQAKLTKSDAEVLETGAVHALGPIGLPVMTGLGGETPSSMGVRRSLGVTGLEVIAVASTEPFLGPLADYQRFALFAALGFLGLGILALLLPNGAAEEAPSMSVPENIRGGRSMTGHTNPAISTAPLAAKPAPGPGPSTLGGGLMTEPSAVPEASPDDFHFGHTRVASVPPSLSSAPLQQAPPDHPGTHPAAEAASPFDFAQSASAPRAPEDFQATASYPAHWPKQDPFSYATENEESGGAGLGTPEDNPDATRVAAIPEALLRASAESTASGKVTVPPAAPSATAAPLDSWRVEPVPPVANGEEEDEQHFHGVFQDYVATRQRCGEPGDSLPYERFAQKLRKNKEQLVQKYGCRTVRFQVYVKDGKAALKATPVKT